MKLAEQFLVAMGEDLTPIKEITKIRSEIHKESISKVNLLHFYDTTSNLIDKYPKNKYIITKLKNEIALLI